MAQTIHDEWYEDIILQAFPVEDERAQLTCYEKRGFRLDDIRSMARTTYTDSFRVLPTPSQSQATAWPWRQPGTTAVMCSALTVRASGISNKTKPNFRQRDTGMGLITAFNLNSIRTRLAMEREADKWGKAETVSRRGARSTR